MRTTEILAQTTLLIHIDAYILIMYTFNMIGEGKDSVQNSSLVYAS